PPDSVEEGRSSDRYPRPIWVKDSSRAERLPRSGATCAEAFCLPSPRTHPARSVICIEQASAMETPSIREVRACSARRVPSHSGQTMRVTARSTKARMCGCIESRSLLSIDFWILGIRPSYVMFAPASRILVGSLYRKSCSWRRVKDLIGCSVRKKAEEANGFSYQRTAE